MLWNSDVWVLLRKNYNIWNYAYQPATTLTPHSLDLQSAIPHPERSGSDRTLPLEICLNVCATAHLIPAGPIVLVSESLKTVLEQVARPSFRQVVVKKAYSLPVSATYVPPVYIEGLESEGSSPHKDVIADIMRRYPAPVPDTRYYELLWAHRSELERTFPKLSPVTVPKAFNQGSSTFDASEDAIRHYGILARAVLFLRADVFDAMLPYLNMPLFAYCYMSYKTMSPVLPQPRLM